MLDGTLYNFAKIILTRTISVKIQSKYGLFGAFRQEPSIRHNMLRRDGLYHLW